MKRLIAMALSVVVVLTLGLVPAAMVSADPGPGIVGLWHFDEGSGAGTVADSSGNGYDGTVYGATTGVAGKFGNALSFDGSGDYVDCGIAVDDTITTGVTLEAWIKPALKQNGGIISNDYTLGNKKGYDFFLWASGTYGRLYIDFGSGTACGRTFWNIPNADWYNQWHHVAATWDGSDIRLYVDGSQVATVAFGGTYFDPGKATLIGGINYGTLPYCSFNGIIDEVRIWNSDLPDFEVSATPEVDFNPIETEHEITATVDPVAPGVTVGLEVTNGPNEGATDSGQTDANGEVTLSYTGGSDDGIDTIRIWVDNNWNGDYDADVDYAITVEKYWLENFVTGGGKLNRATVGADGKPNNAAYTFAGTVGVLADASIVGQFQIVDHTGNKAEAWHAGNGDFTFLNFVGEPAESPEATHDTAIFEGEFTSNRGGTETLRLRLIDNGEPGAGVDTISLWFFDDWVEFTLDGGNFQVHDLPAD